MSLISLTKLANLRVSHRVAGNDVLPMSQFLQENHVLSNIQKLYTYEGVKAYDQVSIHYFRQEPREDDRFNC